MPYGTGGRGARTGPSRQGARFFGALTVRRPVSGIGGRTAPPPVRSGGRGPSPAASGIVIAIAIGVALSTMGVLALTLSGSPPAAAGGPVTFSAARPAAAARLPYGTWILESAFGLDLWNATTFTEDYSAISSNCTLTPLDGPLPAALEIPGYRGDLSTGAAVIWFFTYVQPATNTSAAVMVVNGTAVGIGEISGARCVELPGGFTGIPLNVSGSASAARVVDQGGASAYLAAYRTGASLAMSLYPSYAPPGSPGAFPQWNFAYSPCGGLSPQNLTGPTDGISFDANVDAANGTLVSAGPSPVNCQFNGSGSVSTIFSVFSLGSAGLAIGAGTTGTVASQGCSSGDYCYDLPVTLASGGVDPADFAVWVQSASGATTGIPVGYALENATGGVLVYSMGSEELTWQPAAGNSTVPLAVGDTLWVDMGATDPAGAGYSLAVTGIGAYYGSSEGFSLP